jgi:thiosulfate/3-mercaptopyruvate sulfurtransferase
MSLISATSLADLLAGPDAATVTVLDVRWTLAHPDGRDAFAAGHIPGARYLDLDSQLSDHTRTGLGRHPLPTGPALQESLRTLGVKDGDTVVVYDDAQAAGSSRAWWTLTAAGLEDVRILDGGWAAWQAAGGAVETGAAAVPAPGDITVTHEDLYDGARRTLTKEQAAATGGHDGHSVLLDARAPERYRGETEPVDPVAGHIPGAANLPSTSVLDEAGRFLPADAAARRCSLTSGWGRRPQEVRSRAPTAAPGSPPRSWWPRRIRWASTWPCSPARGPSGRRTWITPDDPVFHTWRASHTLSPAGQRAALPGCPPAEV